MKIVQKMRATKRPHHGRPLFAVYAVARAIATVMTKIVMYQYHCDIHLAPAKSLT